MIEEERDIKGMKKHAQDILAQKGNNFLNVLVGWAGG